MAFWNFPWSKRPAGTPVESDFRVKRSKSFASLKRKKVRYIDTSTLSKSTSPIRRPGTPWPRGKSGRITIPPDANKDNTIEGEDETDDGNASLGRPQYAMIDRDQMVQVRAQDRKLTEEAPSRWDPAIDPNSDKFKSILLSFSEQLSDPKSTIDGVLRSNLSPYERELLFPVSRHENSALAGVQARNRKLYSALLRSDRFADWASSADLSFKLTLVYFGLPVAPMTVHSSQTMPELPEDSDLDMDEDDWDDEAELGRLRFLNSYTRRMYEFDGLRSELPPYYCFRVDVRSD